MTDTLLANRYRVLSTLGEGAMGLVYRVQDTATDAQVALKVISRAYGTSEGSVLLFKK